LYGEHGVTKEEIADLLEVRTNFVLKWTQGEDQGVHEDNRGWQKGRRRKWDEKTVQRITEIRRELKEDPNEACWAATAIEAEYRRR